MKHFQPCRLLLRNQSGATIVEFALIAPMFFFLLFVMIEFGLIRFSQIAIESAVMQASRTASIGKESRQNCDRVCTIRELIATKTAGLIAGDEVSIAAAVVGEGTTSPPDLCITDPPSTPEECPANFTYEDNNGVPGYQGPGSVSLGNAGDLVEIRVSYPWRVQFPMIRYLLNASGTGYAFGPNGVLLITSSTLVKNEPF